MYPDDSNVDYEHLEWIKENIKPRGLSRRLGAFYMVLCDKARRGMVASFREEVPDLVDIIEEEIGHDKDTHRAMLLFYSIIGRVRIIKHLPSPDQNFRTCWEINYELNSLSSYSKDYEERLDFFEDILAGRLRLEDLQEAKGAVRH